MKLYQFLLFTPFSLWDILFILLIAGMILYGIFKKKKKTLIETLDFSKVDTISKGVVKTKGKLQSIDYMNSPITDTKCIGYNYSQLTYQSPCLLYTSDAADD